MKEEKIQKFLKRVEKESLFIEAFGIADEEKILFEHHWVEDRPRNTYSHTKSYLATAIGIAILEGKISLEDRLVECFPEKVPENADALLEKITLRHLLTMSSGFGKALLMGDDRRAGIGMPDYVKYMFQNPLQKKPGSEFTYSTADSILAGRMLEKKIERNLASYLYERLLKPMEIDYPIWECCPQGHPIGGGGMFLRLVDMIKLGQLYLNRGMWKKNRLVEEGWIQEAVTKKIDTPKTNQPGDKWSCGYGYQFWLSPYQEAYRADGAFGQITTVLPRAGLVVSVQCPENGDFDKVREALHEEILLPLDCK